MSPHSGKASVGQTPQTYNGVQFGSRAYTLTRPPGACGAVNPAVDPLSDASSNGFGDWASSGTAGVSMLVAFSDRCFSPARVSM